MYPRRVRADTRSSTRTWLPEVQGGGGLIHQQQPGLLGQSPGRQYKLLLSTGQLREAPVGVVCDPQLLQGLHGDGPLPAARRGERPSRRLVPMSTSSSAV